MIGNKKVLLSGATGFIGSHIATHLLKLGFEVIALKREQSNLWRCKDIYNLILWIDTNKNNWEKKLNKYKPDILIHAAWGGVKAEDRNNWEIQKTNFDFSVKLYNTVIESGVNKIITLGSQAEYGIFSDRINEQFVPQPADAYGATKLHTCNYLRLISQQYKIQWYWLRIFSVFGPRENDSWLLPQVIKSLLKNEPIGLTEGDQLYDYMYINDFTENLMKVINSNNIEFSGIYNYSSGTAIKLKEFLSKLSGIIGVSSDLLDFGSIPYRSIQSMHMEGDCTKFKTVFGAMCFTDIDQSLTETINYYRLIE